MSNVIRNLQKMIKENDLFILVLKKCTNNNFEEKIAIIEKQNLFFRSMIIWLKQTK